MEYTEFNNRSEKINRELEHQALIECGVRFTCVVGWMDVTFFVKDENGVAEKVIYVAIEDDELQYQICDNGMFKAHSDVAKRISAIGKLLDSPSFGMHVANAMEHRKDLEREAIEDELTAGSKENGSSNADYFITLERNDGEYIEPTFPANAITAYGRFEYVYSIIKDMEKRSPFVYCDHEIVKSEKGYQESLEWWKSKGVNITDSYDK